MRTDVVPPILRATASAKPKKSQQVIAALTLAERRAMSTEPMRALPVPDLQRLPHDGSMLYGIGRVDASGRVTDHEIVDALGWRPGDAVEVIVAPWAILMRTSPQGLVSVPRRPCIVIPVTVRRHRRIATGDQVLLAAAPDYGVVLVHTLSELDDMLTDYHSSQSPPS